MQSCMQAVEKALTRHDVRRHRAVHERTKLQRRSRGRHDHEAIAHDGHIARTGKTDDGVTECVQVGHANQSRPTG